MKIERKDPPGEGEENTFIDRRQSEGFSRYGIVERLREQIIRRCTHFLQGLSPRRILQKIMSPASNRNNASETESTPQSPLSSPEIRRWMDWVSVKQEPMEAQEDQQEQDQEDVAAGQALLFKQEFMELEGSVDLADEVQANTSNNELPSFNEILLGVQQASVDPEWAQSFLFSTPRPKRRLSEGIAPGKLKRRRLDPMSTPSIDKPVTCPICKAEFSGKDNLNRHKTRMHGNLRCPHCSLFCNSKKKLKIHMRKTCRKNPNRKENSARTFVRDKFPFYCPVCHIGFKSEGLLKKHETDKPRRHGIGYVCSKCSANFLLVTNFKYHQEQRVCENKSRLPSYECRSCPLKFYRKISLKDHVAFVHRGATLKCGNCPAEFKNKKFWSSHVKQRRCRKSSKKMKTTLEETSSTASRSRGKKTQTSALSCRYCEEKFSETRALNIHAKKAHPQSLGSFERITRNGGLTVVSRKSSGRGGRQSTSSSNPTPQTRRQRARDK